MTDPLATRRGLLLAGGGVLLASTGCARARGGNDTTTPAAFPTVDEAGLAAWRRRLLAVLRTECAAQPPGTKYSQGIEEAWCADFVSWTHRQAGRPLHNPNGGGWRIPGTMTLLDELRRTGAWRVRTGGHRPVAGDIAIYDGDGPFGQHTNMVLGLSGTRLTTIGGNEGAQNVTISTHQLDGSLGLLGFGHLA